MGRVMGIDVGTVRVGIALSDESRIIAKPHVTLRREGNDRTAKAIAAVAAEHGVDRIVVGLPLGLDGAEQKSSEDSRALASAIGGATGLPVVVWDERLTTAQAERALLAANVRREKRREVIDRIAAALMLQSFLDRAAQSSVSGMKEED
jgi:putative Holliday junction resolvase